MAALGATITRRLAATLTQRGGNAGPSPMLALRSTVGLPTRIGSGVAHCGASIGCGIHSYPRSETPPVTATAAARSVPDVAARRAGGGATSRQQQRATSTTAPRLQVDAFDDEFAAAAQAGATGPLARIATTSTARMAAHGHTFATGVGGDSTRQVWGVGTDVTHMPRFERLLELYGNRLVERVCSDDEAAQLRHIPADDVARRTAFLASRWAAKEAAYKALGRWRVLFPELQVEVHSSSGGRTGGAGHHDLDTDDGDDSTTPQRGHQGPRLVLLGEAKAIARQHGVGALHLSLSHDGEYAVAFVVVEFHDPPPS